MMSERKKQSRPTAEEFQQMSPIVRMTWTLADAIDNGNIVALTIDEHLNSFDDGNEALLCTVENMDSHRVVITRLSDKKQFFIPYGHMVAVELI